MPLDRIIIGDFIDAAVDNPANDAPLIDVAVLGNDAVAAVLLEHGADPNAQSELRENVLHCAVASGNARLVDLLLAAGAKADYVTPLNETVFDALPKNRAMRSVIENVLRRHGVQRG